MGRLSQSWNRIDPLDFSYLDNMRLMRAGKGRVFLGRAAAEHPGTPVLTFIHGGCMGAWGFTAYIRYFDILGIASAAVDCRGHGGLEQTEDFVGASIADFTGDVVAACDQLPGPAILAGHSLGALIAGVAQGQVDTAGLVLLAPSPPGQLPNACALAPVPEDQLYRPASGFRDKLLLPGEARDITPFVDRLCPESPVALNERYGLTIQVSPPRGAVPTICIGADHDDPERHPPGQDQAVADFYKARYTLLRNAPHCFMLAQNWIESAALLSDWYRETYSRSA